VAQVHQTVRQYLQDVERKNPVQEPVHEQDQVSTTDPDSTYATKDGMPARLGYYDNYLVDNDSCVIEGVQATAARMSKETVAAQDMLTRFGEWQGHKPESVAADTTYGNGGFLQWLADRKITPYMGTRDSIHLKNSPYYGPECFNHDPENNRYICPAGQPLNYGGRNLGNRSTPYSASGRGLLKVPSIEGGVWIECEGGDIRLPTRTGCWWGRDQLPPRGTTDECSPRPSECSRYLKVGSGTLSHINRP
jgi:hypothetical protein